LFEEFVIATKRSLEKYLCGVVGEVEDEEEDNKEEPDEHAEESEENSIRSSFSKLSDVGEPKFSSSIWSKTSSDSL
jgi:hypothetical protein